MTTRTTNHNSSKYPKQNWTLKNLVVIVIVIYPTTRRVLPPLASLAHTHRLTILLPVKVSKAARWKSEKQRVMQMLNGKWKMLSCWRFAVHSTWERHVDWPAQPSLCDVKQNPDQIWYSYLCGIYMHIYIYINLNQLKSNCSTGFVGESCEEPENWLNWWRSAHLWFNMNTQTVYILHWLWLYPLQSALNELIC